MNSRLLFVYIGRLRKFSRDLAGALTGNATSGSAGISMEDASGGVLMSLAGAGSDISGQCTGGVSRAASQCTLRHSDCLTL